MESYSKTVVILDDEPDILELVTISLKKANFYVKEFLRARDFFTFLETSRPDLIILDLMLPDADGIEICKKLKASEDFKHIPIIMLTAKSDESDKIIGLELGADDYVTKPFSPKVLAARVKAVLRRSNQKNLEYMDKLDIKGILSIDFQKYKVYVENVEIDLTATEFKILKFLANKKGWVFSREQILEYLWGNDKAVLDRTIDVHIRHLRQKLGNAGDLIKNVRGVGYKLDI